MKVAKGETVYSEGNTSCSGIGLKWSDQELNAAVNGPVAGIVFDDRGKADITEILTGLVETEFQQERLSEILSDSDKLENWRVGEAIAETYLTDHCHCYFPWPDGRDERKRGSSLPGADLVGFYADNQGNCLAFGEVKTSSEAQYPPKVMYGQKGLKQQLEDLRDSVSTRDDLVKYLVHRVREANWRGRFKQAVKRYIANASDVQLFGFLVRDVGPNKNDIRVRVKKLGQNCPEGTRIQLLALYLPQGRIKDLGKSLVAQRAGGRS